MYLGAVYVHNNIQITALMFAGNVARVFVICLRPGGKFFLQ